jgi:pimeloyl-ACP methyl ester carboxylesterase
MSSYKTTAIRRELMSKPNFRMALIVAGVLLGLNGCGGSDSNSSPVEVIPTVQYSPTAQIVFDPANGKIPTTNDLLLSGTQDGTLNIPLSGGATDVFSSMLNTLDGFSLTMPFTIALNEIPKASSIKLGQSVRVYEVTKANSLVSSISREVPNSELLVTLDSSGLNLAFVPLKPLKESTSYLVILTNGLQDKNSKAFSTSTSYALLKGSDSFSNATSEALRQQINAQENVVGSAGVAKENIILSWSFTTQSVKPVLNAIKSQAVGQALSTQFTGKNTNNIRVNLPGYADIHQGKLKVPYYLNPQAPLSYFWVGANGGWLTRYNPSPKKIADLDIPVAMIVPNSLSGKVMPTTGWPVVIYQHGITSNRSTIIAIADRLASEGYAVIGIDLPLHGINGLDPETAPFKLPIERTFDVDLVNNETSAAGADGKIDPSGAHFINLSNPLVSRDNIRQAVSDILVLRNSLGNLQSDTGVKLNSNDVSFAGISLGSIVGANYLSIEDRSTTALLSVPGGGIARLLDASVTFGPRIQAGLAAKGLVKGTAAYDQFMAVTQTLLDPADPIVVAGGVGATHQVLLHEVVGSANSPSDQVIPNTVSNAPLSGTEPLIRQMGLTKITATNTAKVDGVVRFSAGGHASLLYPEPSLPVLLEMQEQMADFIETQGQTINIGANTQDIIAQ